MKYGPILIIIVGLALFLFSDLFHWSTSQPTTKAGRVLSVVGTVMGHPTHSESFVNLSVGDEIGRDFKIVTGFKSHALIEFGESFRLEENSSIRLVDTNKAHHVHLIRGTVQRQKVTDQTQFFIDHRLTNQQKIQKTSHQTSLQKKSLSQQPQQEASTNPAEVIVQKTMKLHQRFLEKCFIKHYDHKRGETHTGLISVEFEVGPKGRLDKVLVQDSDYQDEQLHQCVKNVISRVRIKKGHIKEFQKILFPVQFQLPDSPTQKTSQTKDFHD